MEKTIVTHINPDLDAITAAWLLTRFGGDEFRDSKFSFVPAGDRLNDEDQNLVHVDTGLGRLDHHQEERGQEDTCAAKLVYEWLVSEGRIKESEALQRLVAVVNQLDHFQNYFWDDPLNDRYQFLLGSVLNGLRHGNHLKSDQELMQFGLQCLDGILVALKIKVAAEEDLSEGIEFESVWGKTLAIESKNDEVIKIALKKGFKLVVRKDPDLGIVRIKSAPLKKIDLSDLYELLKKKDAEASWYFHPSGHMILNGTIRNPNMKASKLALDELIDAVKEIRGGR